MNKAAHRAATQGICPFRGTRISGALGKGPTLDDWWPERLRVELLHVDPPFGNPLGPSHNYAEAFSQLDLNEVKRDIKQLLRESVSWWPSDYGHYGPQMVRMAWHAAGTYRIADGRGGAAGGMQRFAPLRSWEDNGNIDKSLRLLWPIKRKYGAALSWGDLIVLTGNCALESMGLTTVGFGGGRVDAWEVDRGTYWGPEAEMVTRDRRWKGDPGDDYYDLENPLAASHQSLIYVHPEGPNQEGRPELAARDIRESFARMAMNDEETVALIAGGHAFGKSHGGAPEDQVGNPPDGAPIEAMGLGWLNEHGKGYAEHTMTNGIEGSWTPNPIRWDNDYLTNLLRYDWEKIRGPQGAIQWRPKSDSAPKTPDAHREGVEHDLMMMTTDIALKVDPHYRTICERFVDDFDALSRAFARAWFKLTHRDMGPKSRYLGPEVPKEDFLWQDPLPSPPDVDLEEHDVATLRKAILRTEATVSELVATAWAAASTFRVTDMRGGANGGRLRLAPMRDWPVNNPQQLHRVLDRLEAVKRDFDDAQPLQKSVSMADLIVLGGCVAIEKAAADGGTPITVPFVPGRVDASAAETDPQNIDYLQPVADGFRNYLNPDVGFEVEPEHLFLDRAARLSLTAPEWVCLVGGLRVININYDGSDRGQFTARPGVLSTDYFDILTSMDFEWARDEGADGGFVLKDRETGATRFRASRCDLIFGSNAQLRAIVEVYASTGGTERFLRDFVSAWHKVMMLDRFEISRV